MLLKSRGMGPEAVEIILVIEPSGFFTSNSSGSSSDSELFYASSGLFLLSVYSLSESSDITSSLSSPLFFYFFALTTRGSSPVRVPAQSGNSASSSPFICIIVRFSCPNAT